MSTAKQINIETLTKANENIFKITKEVKKVVASRLGQKSNHTVFAESHQIHYKGKKAGLYTELDLDNITDLSFLQVRGIDCTDFIEKAKKLVANYRKIEAEKEAEINKILEKRGKLVKVKKVYKPFFDKDDQIYKIERQIISYFESGEFDIEKEVLNSADSDLEDILIFYPNSDNLRTWKTEAACKASITKVNKKFLK